MVESQSASSSKPIQTSQRPRGILRILYPFCPQQLLRHKANAVLLQESGSALGRRRRRCLRPPLQNGQDTVNVLDLLTNYSDQPENERFVAFFFLQRPYSAHVLALRKKLAKEYAQKMTIIAVTVNESTSEGTKSKDSIIDDENLAAKSEVDEDVESGWKLDADVPTIEVDMMMLGTGFVHLPVYQSDDSGRILSVLNVTQIPTLIVLDKLTGRRLPSSAALAMEWNGADDVIKKWKSSGSGLTISQTAFAFSTMQGTDNPCCIQ